MGEVVATAPLMPMKLMSGISGAMGAIANAVTQPLRDKPTSDLDAYRDVRDETARRIQAGIKRIGAPFVDDVLRVFDRGDMGPIGGFGLGRGGTDIGNGSGKRRLAAAVQLFVLGRLLAPMAGVDLRRRKKDGKDHSGGDPGHALDVDEPQKHHSTGPMRGVAGGA